jgi:hypothetical protein
LANPMTTIDTLHSILEEQLAIASKKSIQVILAELQD